MCQQGRADIMLESSLGLDITFIYQCAAEPWSLGEHPLPIKYTDKDSTWELEVKLLVLKSKQMIALCNEEHCSSIHQMMTACTCTM